MKGKKKNQIKKNKWDYEKIFEEKAKKKLIKKYDNPIYFHDIKVINDIIYNEKTHFVEAFKEYLIYEDINEFLLKFYSKKEIIKKLPKILIFYAKYSKIYANYTVIPESKYMYKNIKRKQKMIDQIQNDDNNESNKSTLSNQIVFTKNAINSINSITKSIYNNNSDSINLSNQSYNSINKLINKLSNEEEKSKNENNNKKNIKNKNNSNENNCNNLDNKKSINKNNSKKKIISALLSPKTKEKLLEHNMNNNLKNNFFIGKEELKHKFSDNILKNEKILLSANTNSSTKEFIKKILSSPLKKQTILKKKIPIHSSNILNNSNKLNMKHLVFSPKNFKHENYQKIFQNNNIDNLKHISGNKFNYSNKKRSKSNPQSEKPKINNINIINNIKNGTTQINIYTGNDFYKSLNINNHGNLNSNNKSSKSSIDKIFNNNSYNDLKKKNIENNFEINIRKIIQKNILELESSSSRRNNEKKNFLKKLGKYFLNQNYDIKSNSMSNKLSVNGSNLISKIIKKKDSFRKNPKKLKKELSCSCLKYKSFKKKIYSNLNNSNLNKVQKNLSNNKSKKKILNDINLFESKSNHENLIYSERNKSNKIFFEK